MAYFTTRRSSPCAACGCTIQKGEQAWYTKEDGARHPEATCREAQVARHRPNQRAGRCRCGQRVPAGAGRLVRLPEKPGTKAQWDVRCAACG